MLCRRLWRLQGLGISCSPIRRISTASSPVIFSGIQPTGVPHLGNYLGALKQWVQLQQDAASGTKLFYSIVDLHAITLPQKPEQLRQWKKETLAALLAIGLDPERAVIFHQSAVPAHSELMWILSCLASTGYLSRMTQWKDKTEATSERNPTLSPNSSSRLGLFSYPVLQAADVLIHRATHVPVGEDQQQHLEFARKCARDFNHAYGVDILVEPQTILPPPSVCRVMSLQTPTKKMSKSDTDPTSRILLSDSAEDVAAKIMKARTDSTNSVSYDPDTRPGVSNLLEILSGFDNEGRSPAELARDMAGCSLRDLKQQVASAVVVGLGGIRQRYVELLHQDQGKYLDYVAELGARRAREHAEETLSVVRSAVGL